jgi:hypothetical protein
MELFGIWIAALLTLGIFSFLYKDNPVYKATEAIFVGVSAGYWAVVYYFDNIYKKFWEGAVTADNPDYWMYGGAILGVLFLSRLFSKIGWISRWPLAFIVGATAGLYMVIYFVTNAMNQTASTIMDIVSRDASGHIMWMDTFGTVVILVGVVTGLVYFFFSKEHKGAFGTAAKVGTWFLMITFGASFGYTVMSRMSLFIGRVDFLLSDWLHIIK